MTDQATIRRAGVTTQAQYDELRAHEKAVAAAWKPLSRDQLDRVAMIFRGGAIPSMPSPQEVEQREQRAQAEREQRAAEAYAESLTECDVCNIPLSKHDHAARNSYGKFHNWVPGRAEKVIRGKGA